MVPSQLRSFSQVLSAANFRHQTPAAFDPLSFSSISDRRTSSFCFDNETPTYRNVNRYANIGSNQEFTHSRSKAVSANSVAMTRGRLLLSFTVVDDVEAVV